MPGPSLLADTSTSSTGCLTCAEMPRGEPAAPPRGRSRLPRRTVAEHGSVRGTSCSTTFPRPLSLKISLRTSATSWVISRFSAASVSTPIGSSTAISCSRGPFAARRIACRLRSHCRSQLRPPRKSHATGPGGRLLPRSRRVPLATRTGEGTTSVVVPSARTTNARRDATAAVVFHSTTDVGERLVAYGLVPAERLVHAPYGVSPSSPRRPRRPLNCRSRSSRRFCFTLAETSRGSGLMSCSTCLRRCAAGCRGFGSCKWAGRGRSS